MRVQVTRQCDATTGGQPKALFPGQFYDLPDDEVAELIRAGHVVEIRSSSTLPGTPRARGRAKAKDAE